MDEAEKYQQRLQAIAEKRRLQEQQERAKREKEDEKLRMQQLKRKSLRDQWLMEAPPLSPDSMGPRSPFWGPPAQQIDKLQGEAEQLSETVEKLQTQTTEEGSASAPPKTEDHKHTEGEDSVIPVTEDHLVQTDQEELEQAADGMQRAVVTLSTSVLTNGSVADTQPHSAPQEEGEAYANGLPDGPITLTFLGFSDLEQGQGVCDEDNSSTIIHAERVIITDEGQELTEVPQRERSPSQGELTVSDEEKAESADVEPAEMWNHLDISAEPDHCVQDAVLDTDTSAGTSADLTRANSTATSTAYNTDSGTEATASMVAEISADSVLEGQLEPRNPALADEQLHGETAELQFPDGTAEGAEILELFRTQCSAVPGVEAGGQCKRQQDRTCQAVHTGPLSTGRFHEIPLDRGEEASRKAPPSRQQSEKDPLLSSKAAPLTDAARASQADGADSPKMKTCQCCCVM